MLVLWDGHSRGSAQVINACVREYKPVRVLLVRDGRLVPTLFGQENGRLLQRSVRSAGKARDDDHEPYR